jgi:hypothetical protein
VFCLGYQRQEIDAVGLVSLDLFVPQKEIYRLAQSLQSIAKRITVEQRPQAAGLDVYDPDAFDGLKEPPEGAVQIPVLCPVHHERLAGCSRQRRGTGHLPHPVAQPRVYS